MIAAEQNVRDWVNGKKALTGPGNPLPMGAFLRMQASPDSGAYAVVARSGGSSDLVAEQDSNLCAAMIAFAVYSPAEDVAERGAAALASAIEQLTGSPEPCGAPDAPVTVLVADKLAGPVAIPQPGDGGEPYCFGVTAEFTLAAI